MTTITPTRVPGLPAALRRTAAAVTSQIPPWLTVSIVMACAAVAMAALGPAPLDA